jgi:hypothetical protein
MTYFHDYNEGFTSAFPSGPPLIPLHVTKRILRNPRRWIRTAKIAELYDKLNEGNIHYKVIEGEIPNQEIGNLVWGAVIQSYGLEQGEITKDHFVLKFENTRATYEFAQKLEERVDCEVKTAYD